MSVAAAVHCPTISPSAHGSRWTTLVIVMIDVIALEASLLCGYLIRLSFHSLLPITLAPAQLLGPAAGLLMLPFAYYWAGLYPGYGLSPVQRLRLRTYATFTIFAILLAWNYLFEDRSWSCGVILSTMLFALVLPTFLQSLAIKALTKRSLFGVPVIILGAGEASASVARQLKGRPELGLLPVAILDDDMRTWGADVEGVPVCGPVASNGDFCKEAQVAVIAMPELKGESLLRLVQRLAFPTIIIVPDLSGIETLWTMSRDLGGVLGIEVRKNLLRAHNRVSKKILDYAIAIPAFVLSLPCIAVCALWIRIVSPGPVLFRQEREGKNGRPIKVWKLRTMHPNAESILKDYLRSNPEQNEIWKRCYKLKNDPRIIRGVGWFLRVSSLDELPQLWNVIRGDMSLVGPRPFPFYHLASFSKPFRALRKSTAPGLTGLWQVSERSDGDLSVQEAQDTYYIRNWSLWLDIYILLRTIRTVILPKGAY